MSVIQTPETAIRALQSKGLSQAQIAALANTTQATICRILAGQKSIDYKIVDALRKAVRNTSRAKSE